MSRAFINDDVTPVNTPTPTSQQEAAERQAALAEQTKVMFAAQDERIERRGRINAALAELRALR
jgi:hypothetical protein